MSMFRWIGPMILMLDACWIGDDELTAWHRGTEGLALALDQDQSSTRDSFVPLAGEPAWQSFVPSSTNVGLVEVYVATPDARDVELSITIRDDQATPLFTGTEVGPSATTGSFNGFQPTFHFIIEPLLSVDPGRPLVIGLEGDGNGDVFWTGTSFSTYSRGESSYSQSTQYPDHDMRFRVWSWVSQEL